MAHSVGKLRVPVSMGKGEVFWVIDKGAQSQAHLQGQVLAAAGPEEASPAGALWRSL